MADRDDSTDQAQPDVAREATPTTTMVVGVGASAGGLAALRSFFSHVPEQSGLVFVVVVHLNPEYESHLADLLQPHVHMPVRQVTEPVPLQPDHVYVIPPGANLSSVDTHLRLSRLEGSRRERGPIDHFFRTLAATHDGHSVGVVLTGTGSDGALGLKAIKEKNGLAIVQDPGEAEFDGMPQAAIATGVVDEILSLAEIPAALLRFARTQPRLTVPGRDEDVPEDQLQLLQKVFAHVRVRTGRDFTRYKRSTLLRRIQRRMQLREVEELGSYLGLLREDAGEVRALADDILITVTNFFRDPDIWQQLAAEVIPGLFQGKRAGDSVRVWSVGCATGEEAYSLAILLLEEASRREAPPHIQVFASDLHESSLARAREGFYPGDIDADVSPQRLRRYFQKEDGGYRVKKEVREHVVFAPHNLLGDPPFSHLDLVSCRNLLIYLQRDVQREVIELFHYALRPDGVLVLGTSETVEASELFRVEHKKHSLYRKRNVRLREPRLPVFPMMHVRRAGEPRSIEVNTPPVGYGALHQQLVEQYAPPSILVGPDGKVVHISEHAGRYLVIAGGEPTQSAYKLVREELRIELRAALHTARETSRPVRSEPIWVRFDDRRGQVVLEVRSAPEPGQEGFALVIFDERAPAEPQSAPSEPPRKARRRPDPGAQELEAELEQTRQRLQAIVEEYETSQEEMRASTEELQSANEELRSTLEELETSKEELQSMNEELQAVNQENRHKVEELSQLSSDLQNLLSASEIATLFLDRELRILRFTPPVGELFNVRPLDRGRPLSDITHRLGYAELDSDARSVLQTLIPVEREVRDERGRCFLTRVLPYRAGEARIDGIVITLLDISERKRSEEALRESEERNRLIVESARDYAILTTDAGGVIQTWSPGAETVFGWSAQEAIGASVDMTFTPEARAAGDADKERALARREGVAPDVRWHQRQDGSRIFIEGTTRALVDAAGALRGFLKIGQDVTQRREVEEALRQSRERLTAALRTARMAAWEWQPAEGRIVASETAAEVFGLLPGASLESSSSAFGLLHPEDRERHEALVQDAVSRGEGWHAEFRIVRPLDGRVAWLEERATAEPAGASGEQRITGLVWDVTERKAAEELLRQLNDELEERVAERTGELAQAVAALRENEARLAMAMEATDAGWGRWDLPSGRVEWSEHGKRLMGFEADEDAASAQAWLARVHPEDRATVEAEIRAASTEHRDFRLEYRVLHPDGEARYVLGTWRFLYEEGGQAVRATGLVVDITERKRAEDVRTALLRQLVTAEEDERRRISRELHDQMGQQLTGLLLGLHAAQQGGEAAELAPRLRDLEQLSAAIARDLQHLALELRPPALDTLGLVPALQNQIEEWGQRHGLDYDFHAAGLEDYRLSKEAETTLYRVVQEGLTNVAKHSGADHISLIVERRGRVVSVILEDNGSGFDLEQVLASPEKADRLGLRGMRERVALLGGELEIESSPGSGTTVFVRVPDSGLRRGRRVADPRS